jgi:hypothetical protein
LESFSDFVAGAPRTEKTLVEKKFVCNKPGERWLPSDSASEFREPTPLPIVFAAGERDVRLVWPSFRNEPATPGSHCDVLLKLD